MALKTSGDSAAKPPVTPDGRYFVMKGRLWRCTNPSLDEEERAKWVSNLMAARRAVARGNRLKDDEVVRQARAEVHLSKVALGERGPVWWDDGAPDYNRKMARNTPYDDWYRSLPDSG